MQFIRSLFGSSEQSLTQQQKDIFELIKGLHYDELIQLITKSSPNLNYSQKYGQKVTPLILAINSGNADRKMKQSTNISYKITHLLLQNGANPNLQDGSGRTPLMTACHWNLPHLVDLLLDSGADINLPTEKSPHLNPLYDCLFKRRLELAKILVNKGASIQKVFELQEINLKEQTGFNLQQAAIEWLIRLINKRKGILLLSCLREEGNQLLPRQLQHELLSQYL